MAALCIAQVAAIWQISCIVGVNSNLKTSSIRPQCRGDQLIQVTAMAGSTVM